MREFHLDRKYGLSSSFDFSESKTKEILDKKTESANGPNKLGLIELRNIFRF